MSRRPSPAVYRSRELDDLLRRLDPKDKRRRWIENMEAVLRENMFAGELIPKRQIPVFYIELYGVNNLFRYAHPEGYRSCYTIIGVEGLGPCPVILDIRPHSEYDRIFGYRKR